MAMNRGLGYKKLIQKNPAEGGEFLLNALIEKQELSVIHLDYLFQIDRIMTDSTLANHTQHGMGRLETTKIVI